MRYLVTLILVLCLASASATAIAQNTKPLSATDLTQIEPVASLIQCAS